MIIPTDPASTSDSASIFHDGKLKPGIYRIQNIVSQTYLDIRNDSKQLCCRPAAVLEGKGLVGSRSHSIPIAVVLTISSGKYSLRVLAIQFAGYSIESRPSLLPTELQGDVARTRCA